MAFLLVAAGKAATFIVILERFAYRIEADSEVQ
jgi:hypothetical protein